MSIVMFDEVINKKGKVIGIKNILLIEDSMRPEKIYCDHVDYYGDKRDKWLILDDFIKEYGELDSFYIYNK